MRLNLLLYKLENKIRRIAIERLMTIITVCMAIVFAGDFIVGMLAKEPTLSLNYYLHFDRNLIFGGQIWRVLSFIIAYPEAGNPLFTVLALYFFWWIGTSIEGYWGKAKFNLYYLIGIILSIAAGFITGYVTNVFLNLSLFLAFATTFPEQRVLLFFFFPIKVKWLGLAEGALMLYYLLIAIIGGSLPTIASILAAIITYLIFFGYNLINLIKRAYSDYKYRKNGWH
jgi:hypothetical protein